jgi:hypothetical protein
VAIISRDGVFEVENETEEEKGLCIDQRNGFWFGPTNEGEKGEGGFLRKAPFEVSLMGCVTRNPTTKNSLL